ncbi:MAG: hypothetical protein VR72_08960 [Clostridiaceae bacterium BRH_c20a]|nr:MAG: hypothetical protein VR72_08960 [Clostridiaceae bacterium BRH_c20a]
MRKLSVISMSDNQLIGDKIKLADTFTTRLKGLLGKSELQEGEGLILAPCNAIHCIGMKFAIDVIFMNKYKQVVWLRENMKPGTKEAKLDAVFVLEVASGVVKEKGIEIGHVLSW